MESKKWETVSQTRINKTRLSRNQYTISLLNEGLRVRMLNGEEVYDVQGQLMHILKGLIRRYTQGESSSVPSDTAEGILTSILYAIDAYMLHFNDPDKAITYLKTVNVRSMYEKGVELVRQCFEETKQLYKDINSHKLDVTVDAYNTTIEESIPVFLKKYEIIFGAHHTMASIDYPLAIDDMSIQGVFYIKQYLQRLKMETRFCRMFSHQELQETLVSFGRVCGFDYQIELFNIFQLMFNNAVFSILSGGNANQVRIAVSQYEQLERQFNHLDASKIRLVIREAIKRLQSGLNISDPQMTDYMNQCGSDLIHQVINAANHHNLQTVIITKKEEEPKKLVTSFKESDRMSDNRFRSYIEEIMECQRTEDKVQLIKANFHSLPDYVDMLNSNCLFGNEYEALFETFGDIELAILAKMVFYEELRSGSFDLSSSAFRVKEPETEWQMHYIDFMKKLNKTRTASIEEWIHDIDYEEMKFD